MKLIIEGSLIDFNSFQNQTRANKFTGAKIKRYETEKVAWACKACKLPKIKGLHNYIITWFVTNKLKDKDNIMFAQKFIFDGLQKAGVIENDGWSEVGDIIHKFKIDKVNPRIEVEIKECM